MSWLDIILLLPLLIGLVKGLMKGLVVELMSIAAIILGYVGTRVWGAITTTWLLQQFAWPEAVCLVVAHAALFIGIALVLNIVGKLLSKLFQTISLGWLNRALGALFGVLKWAFIMLMLVLCVHRLDSQFHFMKAELKQQSLLYSRATPLSEKVWERVKTELGNISQEKLPINDTKDEQK